MRTGPTTPGWTPTSFEPVDFNGDGRPDLAGAFADRIEFRPGDGSGAFLAGYAEQTFPVTGDVAVGTLDSDGFGDILLPTSPGLLVWRGQVDGPPLQAAYSAIATPNIWVIPLREPSLQRAVYFFHGMKGLEAGLTGDEYQAFPTVVVGEGKTLADLGDKVAVADLDHDERDEVVIAFAGDRSVSAYSAGKNNLGAGDLLKRIAEIDVSQPKACAQCQGRVTDLRIASGVLVADVDGDLDQDLLANVAGASLDGDAVAVALGDGAGAFDLPYIDERFAFLASPLTAHPTAPPAASLSSMPLAAGDLNGDGKADYVSPNGVFFAGEAFEQIELRDWAEPWTAASIADLDGDGTRDVVAIAKGEPFVDVLRCGSGEASCATEGTFYDDRLYPARGVEKLRVGRLDGPGPVDIALVEAGPDSGDEADSLSILYGRSLGFPEEPVTRARFHRIDQLEVGRLASLASPGGDSYDDVIVSTRGKPGTNPLGEPSVGILFGGAEQQLSSPFFLGAPGGYGAARQALPGRFSGREEPYADLVILGEGEAAPRVYWVPGHEDAAFSAAGTGQDFTALEAATQQPGPFDLDCARFTAGDIDADGRDEVVGVMGRVVCSEHPITALAVGRVPAGATELDEISFDAREIATADLADASVFGLTDFDGDGSADLVVAGESRVLVYWGGPSGLALEPMALDLPLGEPVLDMTKIARSPGARGASRIAVLTSASVVVLYPDGRTELVASVSARKLRSADVDGDGLGDFLLLDDAGIQVLLATEAPPLGSRR